MATQKDNQNLIKIKSDYRLMQVESIAESFKGSILLQREHSAPKGAFCNTFYLH